METTNTTRISRITGPAFAAQTLLNLQEKLARSWAQGEIDECPFCHVVSLPGDDDCFHYRELAAYVRYYAGDDIPRLSDEQEIQEKAERHIVLAWITKQEEDGKTLARWEARVRGQGITTRTETFYSQMSAQDWAQRNAGQGFGVDIHDRVNGLKVAEVSA